jgi:signal transduction histidine kinase
MFEGARAISTALLASGLAAAALLAATLSLALTSAFSRLAPALAALRLIGQGTFTHKLDIPEGPSLNEISLLGREINDASDSLERLGDSLLQTQSQLAQSEKLASIGQLAAGVAHEINNPIGFISSNANTLTEYCDDLLEVARKAKALCQSEPLPSNPLAAELALSLDSAGLDWLEADIPTLLSETKDGIERVRVIVQSLKDFSRPDANDGQWIMSDLCAGLRSSCVIARNEVKYIADIVDELPPTLEAECHPQALNQVFLNIIVNAAHAISALGSERGTIRLRAGSDGAFAWIDISDNGTGMDDQTIQRVFDPFFTTKPVGKGTGLGLSIAHGIVAGKHRGSIAIQSAPGQGSTFTLRIPLRQVSPLPNHPNPP